MSSYRHGSAGFRLGDIGDIGRRRCRIATDGGEDGIEELSRDQSYDHTSVVL